MAKNIAETYIVGVKVRGVGVEFRSEPIPKEEAISVYTTMNENPDYCDAVLYCENGKGETVVSEADIEKILNSEE